jgi:hypothetical protein
MHDVSGLADHTHTGNPDQWHNSSTDFSDICPCTCNGYAASALAEMTVLQDPAADSSALHTPDDFLLSSGMVRNILKSHRIESVMFP